MGIDDDDAVAGVEGEDGTQRTVTFSQLHAEANQVANALRSLGLESGDRVALCLPVVPEILSILYGCFKAGLTVVPIFAGFGSAAIATRLRDSGARALFTANHLERRGKLLPLAERMPPVPSIGGTPGGDDAGKRESAPDGRRESPQPAPRR